MKIYNSSYYFCCLLHSGPIKYVIIFLLRHFTLAEWMFVWLLRESKFICFHGCITALGGCMPCSGCPDAAWAAIFNQCSRGGRCCPGPSPLHMVEQQLVYSSWIWIPDHHTDRRFSLFRKTHADQAAVPHLCWESSDFVLTLFPYWLLWKSSLVGFSMANFNRHVLRQSVSDWQMNDRCHSHVIHLHYLSSLCSFSYHATCKFLNKRTSLILNYSFSPASSPVPCASVFCISRDTSCELALSYEHPNLPPLPGYFFYCNFQLFKGWAKNCGNVWIEIDLVRGAP